MAMPGQGGSLHGQDGEDAGHEIEDETAQEGEGDGAQEAATAAGRRGSGGGRAKARGPCGDGTWPGVDLVDLAVHLKDPGEAGGRGGTRRGLQGEGQPVRSAIEGLGGGMVDDTPDIGEEIDRPGVAPGDRCARGGQSQARGSGFQDGLDLTGPGRGGKGGFDLRGPDGIGGSRA